jgi:Uma2 family endonuclease
VLHSIVVALAQWLELPFKMGGSFTMRREDVDRGLEADRCYYFRNARKIIGKRNVSLDRDPPPDLAIEVEVTRRLLDRESIYAKLGVPELWRFGDGRLRVSILRRGKYAEVERSPTFPGISPAQIERLVARSHSMDDLEWMTWMQQWIRRNVGGGRKRRR